MNKKSILVIFGEDLPKKNKKWWRQFEKVVGSKTLKKEIPGPELFFVDIETLVNFGSVQKAYEIITKVSRLTFSDGSRVSKSINYQGYELWWMNYDNLYKDFCLPYTQYQNLLLYLKDFDKIFLYRPPCPFLFQYFLKAHHRQYIIFGKFRPRNLLPFPLGVFLQLLLSLGFLLWLGFVRPWLLLRIGDKFNPPRDYDLRSKFIYEELREKKISFVEFVRSLEPWFIVLQHAWRRKRPVVYSTAIISFIYFLANLFGKERRKELISSSLSQNPEQYFWLLVATHYIHNIRGTIWSIQVMKFILRWIGVKAAIIHSGTSRILHEVLACKLSGIKTVGVQHGTPARYSIVSDFMSEFTGQKQLSADKYGLWSEWWKSYYLKYGRAYKQEQLYVSGPMRPLTIQPKDHSSTGNGAIKVLFISEQLSDPKEILPYFLTVLNAKDFEIFFKFRPYRDGFELWLKENYQEIYKKILETTKILRGSMEEAVDLCDVVVGTHSTAVLEALLQLKPFIFFRTNKWGDYFDVKSFDTQGRFFAENPKELINCIRKSVDMPKEDLRQLQRRFFGDPYQNGSKWAVEQALEFAKKYRR